MGTAEAPLLQSGPGTTEIGFAHPSARLTLQAARRLSVLRPMSMQVGAGEEVRGPWLEEHLPAPFLTAAPLPTPSLILRPEQSPSVEPKFFVNGAVGATA
eukprot:CAMPEP_0174376070 /NCGR_PEP_ID=MMETSP0811_2-20130205/116904_1 /TAXON_ID=73025 ORGANISM="Eutreptiella gymnastica-like, Strain CCMP1594" /NCGR_SAMPLE_ID=MMETSP0811_2 /ASSEMBLY_ACC=CAM_ASM_000667 /LENGTH=99 /DNA_ID=CAMNT_0015526919 /DNA_START=20 /DNA_END=320 /DNA_ORIENTATION=+